VLPWLHLIFEAWEDYKQRKEREASAREAQEAIVHQAVAGDDDAFDHADDDNGAGDARHDKKKKKKKHKK